ncbi:MAG: hypothetical protein ABEJ46_04870 [Gemmatimonadota bacterium]
MTDAAELDGRELDAAVARELFGREVSWEERSGERVPVVTDRDPPAPCPRYSTDPSRAREMEEEVDRRGLAEAYVDHLLKEERPRLGIVDTLQYRDVWNVLHAGPARRCRAAVAVAREAAGES